MTTLTSSTEELEATTSSSDESSKPDLEKVRDGLFSLDSPPPLLRDDRIRLFPRYEPNALPSRPRKSSWVRRVFTRVYKFLRPRRNKRAPPTPTPTYELGRINNRRLKGLPNTGTVSTPPDKIQIHPGAATLPKDKRGGGDSSTQAGSSAVKLLPSENISCSGEKIGSRRNLALELARDQDTMDDKRRFFKWYHVIRSLSSGTFSRVYLAYHRFSGEFVAVKKIDKYEQGHEISRSLLEIEALKVLDHPNICKLYQTFDSGKYLLIVLEVCRGDLFDVINKHGQLKEHLARQIFGQLASAVNYMHSKGWVHRDLKPENVLFDPNGNVKLIDFNLSARIMYRGVLGWNKLETHCGTLEYAAPELVRPDKLYEGPPVDSWSLGVLLFTMLAGRFPFEEPERKEKILRGLYQPPPNLSFTGRHLLIRLLDIDPRNRLSPSQILTHPWITTRDKKHSKVSLPSSRFQQNRAFEERELVDYLSPHLNLSPSDLRRQLVHKAYNTFEVGTFNIFERKKEILGRTEFECWKTFWLRNANVGNGEELSKQALWFSKPPF